MGKVAVDFFARCGIKYKYKNLEGEYRYEKQSRRINCFNGIGHVVLSLSACAPVDKDYGVQSSEPVQVHKTAKKAPENVRRPAIMSDDKVMPKFVDISLFDEENYSSVYLGKKFRFNVTYSGSELNAPTTLAALEKQRLEALPKTKSITRSLLYTPAIRLTRFSQTTRALCLRRYFYNSSNSSVKMKKCSIVKLLH